MQGINTRYTGLELAMAYEFSPIWTVSAIASLGQSFYTKSPQVQVFNDNDTNTVPKGKDVFIKNYYLGVGPQSAYTLGIAYNSKKYWFIKINANYFERNFVSINPSRRSIEAAEFIPQNNPQFKQIFDQEKLPSFFTIDLSAGKSFRLQKWIPNIAHTTMLYANIGVSNLLDNKTIVSSGFEQLRYDFTNNNPDKFPNKYINGFGRTYFFNISVKF
jgi:hypothetical protein